MASQISTNRSHRSFSAASRAVPPSASPPAISTLRSSGIDARDHGEESIGANVAASPEEQHHVPSAHGRRDQTTAHAGRTRTGAGCSATTAEAPCVAGDQMPGTGPISVQIVGYGPTDEPDAGTMTNG